MGCMFLHQILRAHDCLFVRNLESEILHWDSITMLVGKEALSPEDKLALEFLDRFRACVRGTRFV
jgi:hypothetical protein